MKYEYNVEVLTFDYWLLSMYNTYHSIVGVVNLVFFASMIGLCFRFFNNVGYGLQTVMFVGLLLIPVIHPFGVYFKAKSQMMLSPKGTKLQFSDTGMRVVLGDKTEMIRYNKLAAVTKRCGMVIIYSDASHGYILTKRVLKKDEEAFLEYLNNKIKESKR